MNANLTTGKQIGGGFHGRRHFRHEAAVAIAPHALERNGGGDLLPRMARAEGPATSAVNTTGLAITDDTVTVGILHSVTGTMAISETGSVEAEKLAILQINEQGGVLGRKIKFVQEDGASDWPTFAEEAKKLLAGDHCAAVFGCWTSASRKAVLPVFEQLNGMLYYPTFYEGLEQSKNVIYTGTTGTSIFEISLGRDKHLEVSRFRLVTLRPVVSTLECLTHPLDAPSRKPHALGMKALCSEIQSRFPGVVSAKGNGPSYWLENCFWDQRHSEEVVRQNNLVRLIRLSTSEGRSLLIEPAEVLLLELRAMAKAAGDAKWDPDCDKKIILREVLRGWWEQRTDELIKGSAQASGSKLAAKMRMAGLPDELVGLAVELRQGYAAASRTSRYLESNEAERLQRRVQSEVVSLRARLIAGQLSLDGAGFHALCLDRMDAVNAERAPAVEDRSAFLKGCMYDIADRCLLRFERPA